jgi:hypothetical protein
MTWLLAQLFIAAAARINANPQPDLNRVTRELVDSFV